MEVQTTQVNLKAIRETQTKIKHTETFMWFYISIVITSIYYII